MYSGSRPPTNPGYASNPGSVPQSAHSMRSNIPGTPQTPLIPNEPPQPIVIGDTLELEHVIGYTGHYPHTLLYHPTIPNNIVYSLGSLVVVQNTQDKHKQSFFRGHEEEVTAIDISPRGDLIASGQLATTSRRGFDAAVIVWSIKTSSPIFVFDGLKDIVTSVTFSPDGAFLSATGGPNQMIIWDLRTGEVVANTHSTSPYSCMLWGPMDNSERHPKYLLILCSDVNVYYNYMVYDIRNNGYALTTEKCQLPNVGLVRSYTCGVISPDGQYVILGTNSGEFCVYSIVTKIFRISIPVSHNGIISICRAGDMLYLGSGDGIVKRFTGTDQTWYNAGQVQLKGEIMSISLHPQGTDLVVGTNVGIIYHINPNDFSVSVLAESHIRAVTAVDFGMKSDVFATGSLDGSVRVWDLVEYHDIVNIQQTCECLCLAYTKSDLLCSGWKDQFIRVHSARDGRILFNIPNAHRSPIITIAANENMIVTGSQMNGNIRVWSTNGNQKMITEFIEPQKGVSTVKIDVDDDQLVHITTFDKLILTFDLIQNKRTVRHIVTTNPGIALAQSRVGEKELLVGCSDGNIFYFDRDYNDPVLAFADQNRACINCIDVSHNGQFVVMACSDETIKLYSLQGKILAIGHLHTQGVTSVKWSPDDKQIIATSNDCGISIWNFYGI